MVAPDWSFARRPTWLASHLFAVVVIVGCVLLGLWQLDRLDQRQHTNAIVRDRSTRPPATVVEALGSLDPEDADYLAVRDTGTYVAEEQVVIRNRGQGGAAGSWVVTPLRTAVGATVLVNRGFVPDVTAQPDDVPVPAGEVEVTGWLRASQERGAIGPRDAAEGRLTALARIDVERIDAQMPEDLVPVWVQLDTQVPAAGAGDPDPVPLPDLSEGNHLSYAVQWFIFGSLGAVVYVALLRRRARELPGRTDGPPDSDTDGFDRVDDGFTAVSSTRRG